MYEGLSMTEARRRFDISVLSFEVMQFQNPLCLMQSRMWRPYGVELPVPHDPCSPHKELHKETPRSEISNAPDFPTGTSLVTFSTFV
jgi:hypothetical protein